MNSERPSEAPEEPYQRSTPALMSPASPKPLHFPTPTNIPVLEMQMDVGFNQTEAHMSDPAMRNTEVRPDYWRDPNEQQEADEASPYSTGGEAEVMKEETAAVYPEAVPSGDTTDSKDIIANDEDPQGPVISSNEMSHQANGQLETETAAETAAKPTTFDAPQPSSDPSIPIAEPTAEPDDVPNQASEVMLDEQAQPAAAPAFNTAVDVQSLLDTLQVPPSAASASALGVGSAWIPSQAGVEASPQSATGLGSSPIGLPARPPPQEQPLINPNYVHSQHIRDYHPHAAHPAYQPHHVRPGSQGNVADPNSKNYVPPVHTPSDADAPAGSAQVFASHFASPTSATNPQSTIPTPFSAQGYGLANTPIESQREIKLAAGETPTTEDRPWDASVQAKYDRFIEAERGYVSEGRWEQFPQGSRLFVGTRNLNGSKTSIYEKTLTSDEPAGNLSSEKVTKRDIFHVFHTYGELAQISIKQAYGFVQFLRTDDCMRALENEQGTQIRDKRIHLEISKPQKNRNSNQSQAVRRSRSPDYNRGKPASNVDRFVPGGGSGGSRGSMGRPSAREAGFRGYRSPSPRGAYRDRYDDRYRERSPAYGRGSKFRSPSPRREEEDDLPLPKRAPRDVPDVQILVLDTLDRDFISWVEQAFAARGVRVDVLLLSPRLNEQAVVRRQIVEGVIAVSKLTRTNQNTGKIGLQIFDRSRGVGNVQFEEYDNLDPPICVELVLRAKQKQAVPPPAYGGGGYGYGATSQPPPQQQQQQQQQQQYGGYGAPPYGQQPTAYPPSYAQPAASSAPPAHLQNLITSLDPNGLQNLLSAMNQQQSPNTPQTAGYSASAGYSANSAQGFAQQQQAAMTALQQNPAMASVVQQQYQQQQQAPQMPQQQGGGQVNMQDILARLGTYK